MALNKIRTTWEINVGFFFFDRICLILSFQECQRLVQTRRKHGNFILRNMNERSRLPQTGRLIVGSSVSCKSSIFANTNCFNQSACREPRPQRRPAKRGNAALAFWRAKHTAPAGRPARLKTDNIQQHVELWPLIHQRPEIYGSNQSRCLLLEIEREWRQRGREQRRLDGRRRMWSRGVNVTFFFFFFHLSEAPRLCLDSAAGWCAIQRSALISPLTRSKALP